MLPYLLIAGAVLVLDQVTKWLVQASMAPFQSIRWVDGVFSLTYVKNYGAAFGILYYQTFLLIGITLALFAVIWVNRRQFHLQSRIFRLGLALALGGAAGNFLDRVRLGYVVDFLDLQYWPVFNLADTGIVIGVALIIYALLREDFAKKAGRREQLPEEYRGGDQ